MPKTPKLFARKSPTTSAISTHWRIIPPTRLTTALSETYKLTSFLRVAQASSVCAHVRDTTPLARQPLEIRERIESFPVAQASACEGSVLLAAMEMHTT